MDYQGRKRKYENKDTEYVKRGKRINLGQLDRGFRRHLPEGFETAPLTGGCPSDVSIMSNWNVVKLTRLQNMGPQNLTEFDFSHPRLRAPTFASS